MVVPARGGGQGRRSRSPRRHQYGRAGDPVGGQVGVTDHAHIGAGARIAAKSGVIGDIPPGSTVAGFPAISRWRWLRAMARR